MRQRDDWHLTEQVRHETGRGDPFAAAMRATRMPMVICDPRLPDMPIVFVNQAFQDLTGYDREEIIGRNCRFLQGPGTDKTAVERIRTALAEERSLNVDILNYRKDGSTFWNALYLSPTHGHDGSVQFFFASQLDVTARIEAQRLLAEQKAVVEEEVRKRTLLLEEALEAKTLLLHEVDHRVKNNLTMIGSLLRLQARQIGDAAVSAKLNAMLERIDALAAVHRRLYQADDVSKFDIGAYASNLVADVIGASGRTDIRVVEDIETLEIGSNHASALGLVISELVTNAIKHAFASGRPGVLTLCVKPIGGRGFISVSDDGCGMGADLGAGLGAAGLGQTLIKRLSAQVGAKPEWSQGRPGTTVTLDFPLSK